MIRVEQDLGYAIPVAQIYKNQMPHVTAAIQPAHQHHFPAGMGSAQFPTTVGSFQVA
jgi:hypothetical protein